MKIIIKNIVFSIVFLLSIVFSYIVYFQDSKINFNIEVTDENNTTPDSLISDSEISEENQIPNPGEKLQVVGINKQLIYFYVTCRLSRPSIPVWQPPKFS